MFGDTYGEIKRSLARRNPSDSNQDRHDRLDPIQFSDPAVIEDPDSINDRRLTTLIPFCRLARASARHKADPLELPQCQGAGGTAKAEPLAGSMRFRRAGVQTPKTLVQQVTEEEERRHARPV